MLKLVEEEFLMIYKPKNFPLHELLPKWHWRCWNKYEQVWYLFPYEVLWQLQTLRDRFGPATVNNWYYGGNLQYCGYRPLKCKVGAKFSLHKFGLAMDMHFEKVSVEEVREDILKNQGAKFYQYINAVEMVTNTHLHWDKRNKIPDKKILKIYP